MLHNLPHRHSPSKRPQGFTLIELLMVIAVILILTGITFGISRGVQNAQARAKTKAELATISQAIEQFKSRYGDYPWHDSSITDYPTPNGGDPTNTMLLFALTGRLTMELQGNGSIQVSKVDDKLSNLSVEKNPSFIDVTKFFTSGTDEIPTQLMDPWGNPYIYWYKWENTENSAMNNPSAECWDVFGYHLYSTGPNGESANTAIKAEIPNETKGILTDSFREVANAQGIIFAGE
jgi:prepilin-type N-terminal cleavage/methylation domain-containing protein